MDEIAGCFSIFVKLDHGVKNRGRHDAVRCMGFWFCIPRYFHGIRRRHTNGYSSRRIPVQSTLERRTYPEIKTSSGCKGRQMALMRYPQINLNVVQCKVLMHTELLRLRFVIDDDHKQTLQPEPGREVHTTPTCISHRNCTQKICMHIQHCEFSFQGLDLLEKQHPSTERSLLGCLDQVRRIRLCIVALFLLRGPACLAEWLFHKHTQVLSPTTAVRLWFRLRRCPDRGFDT